MAELFAMWSLLTYLRTNLNLLLHTTMKKSLKPVDSKKNPGLSKLPTEVRNKMGYAKKGMKMTYADGGSMAPKPVKVKKSMEQIKKEAPSMTYSRNMAPTTPVKKTMSSKYAPSVDAAGNPMSTFAKGGKKWIKDAIKNPGAFTKKAKSAGMSTSAYANKVTKPGSKASTTTKRQANLAKTLSKMKKK